MTIYRKVKVSDRLPEIKSILRAYYKLWNHDGAMYVHAMKGKFRVLYPDGQISQPMSWKVAKAYKEIFGGRIIDNF